MNERMTTDVRSSIAVLVSTSRHPLSGLPCPSRNDALALEIGRQLAGGVPRILHAGDPADSAVADYLALGAAVIEVLPADVGDHFVPALAQQLRETALVLCGCRAESGIASGVLPYALAAALNRPIVANVLEVRLEDNVAHLVQFLPKGQRRRIDVLLPAVIAIHPRAAGEPRYAYARRIAGHIHTLPSDAVVRSRDADAWNIDTAERPPVKLRAVDRRTGHARMLSATGAVQRGGQVVIEGSSIAKAHALLAYLRQHQLIDA